MYDKKKSSPVPDRGAGGAKYELELGGGPAALFCRTT